MHVWIEAIAPAGSADESPASLPVHETADDGRTAPVHRPASVKASEAMVDSCGRRGGGGGGGVAGRGRRVHAARGLGAESGSNFSRGRDLREGGREGRESAEEGRVEAVECMPLSTAEETVSADDGREGLEVASNDLVPVMPADTGPKAAAHPASLALYSSSAVPSSTSLPRQHAPPQPSHPATHDP